MNAYEIIDYINEFVQVNPAAAIAGAFILVVLLFWRPKLFLILLGIVAAGIGVAHLFSVLSSTGLGKAKTSFMR